MIEALSIQPGSICVLWANSHRREIVRITRRLARSSDGEHTTWGTVPFENESVSEFEAADHELTLIATEMELIAWMAR